MTIVDKIKEAVNLDKIIIKKHALTRMLERKFKSDEIKEIFNDFIILENYSDDKPFPSFLIFGYIKSRPVHIVVSYDSEYEIVFIITVYEPTIELWTEEFKIRRKKL